MITTWVAVLGPLLRAVSVYVSVPPTFTGFGLSVFSIWRSIVGGGGGEGRRRRRGGGGGCVTVTSAVSVSVTSGPTGGVPVAVALFVKSAVTFASVHS